MIYQLKFISEQTAFKILVEKTGILISFTAKSRAYNLFLSSKLIGIKISPTTDPYPGIVELCDYDLTMIGINWDNLSNVLIRDRNAIPHLRNSLLSQSKKI